MTIAAPYLVDVWYLGSWGGGGGGRGGWGNSSTMVAQRADCRCDTVADNIKV